jgi:HD-GYP domain-containing protein (c-di-GMP phosphodiesterase class II)
MIIYPGKVTSVLRFKLRNPIHTLDNQLLFAPGDLLTEDNLKAVIHPQKAYSYQIYPLLLYGSIKDDCQNFLSLPPYKAIFLDKKQINDLMKILETIHLPISIFQSLDYFKKRDFYTYVHILMVFSLSALLAEDLLPDLKERIQLSVTGPTHDIGKVCVPLHILRKTTPLTRTERESIEHHTVAGYVLLSYYYKDIQHLSCKVALEHHERRDGSGYPQGIPLKDPLVEIIAVSDIYDALTKPRPYRSTPYDNRTALEEITEMAKQNKLGWDPVKALIAHNRKNKPHYKEIVVSFEKRGTPPSYNVHGKIAEEEKESKD